MDSRYFSDNILTEKVRLDVGLLFLSSIFPFISYSFKLPQILLSFSLYFSVIFICIMVCTKSFLNIFIKPIKIQDVLFGLAFALSALLVLRQYLAHAPMIILRNNLFFIALFCLIYYLSEFTITKKELKILCLTCMLCILALFPLVFLRTSYDVNSYSERLYLNYPNSNIISFVLLILVVYARIGTKVLKDNKLLSLCWFSIAAAAIMIYKTGSRASLIGTIFFLFFTFYVKKEYFINKFFVLVLAFMPILTVFIQKPIELIVNSLPYFNQRPGLSGRGELWQFMLNFWQQHNMLLLFGSDKLIFDYHQILSYAGNVNLQHIWTNGLISFLIYFLMIAYLIKKLPKKINQVSYISLMGFLAIMLNSCAESHLVDSIFGETVLTFLILSISIKNCDGGLDVYDTAGADRKGLRLHSSL